ncbi:uncharacterized protein LOC133850400 [Drosophila sulfurigaster albostrigata]|uniref:uncharacterized protein LOC133850400 n=1 Tax=Drosophila sulfurigaster albostrigata TaxID=89887 RepID=UPI002D218DCD|nr:uncharacterized protein LOC133850400 [Drosophila sulfurigaster albostrigata]
MASYLKDFEMQSREQYHQQFLGGFNEEFFQRQQQQQQQQRISMSDIGTETDRLSKKKKNVKNSKKKIEIQENFFWISVSGYHLDHVGLVYSFFVDIGQVIDRIFTESNFMYLKYANITDCEIALSYDGQKIGYAGDILVRVRPENPMIDYKLHTVIEEEEEQETEMEEEQAKAEEVAQVIDQSVSISVIEVEKPQQVQQTLTIGKVVSIVPITAKNARKARKTGFLQWLKQKVSYIFYYY